MTNMHKSNATTTFKTQFSLKDKATRPYGLGYAKRVQLTKFIQTEEGRRLSGVDCTRPSLNAKRESRIRNVISEFLSLCIKASHDVMERDIDSTESAYVKNEQRREAKEMLRTLTDDHRRVGVARNLSEGSYFLFAGFWRALDSIEFETMREKWIRDEMDELSDSLCVARVQSVEPPTTTTTRREVTIEPEMEAPTPPSPVERPSTPVNLPPPPPAPPPTPMPPQSTPQPPPQSPPWTTTPKAKAAPKRPRAEVEQLTGLAGRVLSTFETRRSNPFVVFNDKFMAECETFGDYQIVLKKRKGGRSEGHIDGYVYLSGIAKKRHASTVKKGQSNTATLRSAKEIRAHFATHPDLNTD